jgi:hypothetical protein
MTARQGSVSHYTPPNFLFTHTLSLSLYLYLDCSTIHFFIFFNLKIYFIIGSFFHLFAFSIRVYFTVYMSIYFITSSVSSIHPIRIFSLLFFLIAYFTKLRKPLISSSHLALSTIAPWPEFSALCSQETLFVLLLVLISVSG